MAAWGVVGRLTQEGQEHFLFGTLAHGQETSMKRLMPVTGVTFLPQLSPRSRLWLTPEALTTFGGCCALPAIRPRRRRMRSTYGRVACKFLGRSELSQVTAASWLVAARRLTSGRSCPRGSATPDSRHKLRNAGRVFAANRETRNLRGEIRLKRTCDTC
jgi:hypothetical protein